MQSWTHQNIFMKFLSFYKAQFDQYLNEREILDTPQGLYAPINYILSIGGKRLRPVAVLMAYHLFKEDLEVALPAAYALEVFHNFTLVHDDIMDDAPLRRGKVTVHEKYDVNTGILSGDVMLIRAYDYLLKIESPLAKIQTLEVFTSVAREVCEGQQYDVDFETRNDVVIEEYLKMIELKTAVLFAAALKIGAILAEATDDQSQNLYEFGRKIGIAFQLQDDLLDSFGDPSKFGKKVGGDIAQNKKTFLVLKALQTADKATQKELLQWMSLKPENEEEKISAVKDIFLRSGVVKDLEALQEAYRVAAFDALDKVKGNPDRINNLKQLANYLLGREV